MESVAPEDDAALVQVARRIVQLGPRTIGLFAADPAIDARALCLRVGGTLGHVTNEPVALLEPERMDGPAASKGAGAGNTPESITLARLLRRVRPSAPRTLTPAEVLSWIGELRLSPGRVLVDLSSLRARGEHIGVCPALDGTIVAAAARRTRHDTLTSACAELGQSPLLGVLLVEVEGKSPKKVEPTGRAAPTSSR
jgi:hypothetical protein